MWYTLDQAITQIACDPKNLVEYATDCDLKGQKWIVRYQPANQTLCDQRLNVTPSTQANCSTFYFYGITGVAEAETKTMQQNTSMFTDFDPSSLVTRVGCVKTACMSNHTAECDTVEPTCAKHVL
jgi:hypothetical protein